MSGGFFNLFKQSKQEEGAKSTFDLTEESSEVVIPQETIDKSKDVLKNLLSDAGFDGDVVAKTNDNTIKLDIINTQDAGRLIGKEGRTLKALQTLVRAIFFKQFPDASYQVFVDLEKYRYNRIENVKKKAQKEAKELSKSQPSKRLEPMPAVERRAIHLLFENHKTVETYSEGEGAKRCVVLALKD